MRTCPRAQGRTRPHRDESRPPSKSAVRVPYVTVSSGPATVGSSGVWAPAVRAKYTSAPAAAPGPRSGHAPGPPLPLDLGVNRPPPPTSPPPAVALDRRPTALPAAGEDGGPTVAGPASAPAPSDASVAHSGTTAKRKGASTSPFSGC
jgi:hypothetical protein